MAADILDGAGHIPGDYGWIAPVYQTTERGIDAIREIAQPPIARIRGSSPRYVDVLSGQSRIFFLSADNEDSIRGYGFRGVVVDEAPYVSLNAWNYVIRPTLSDLAGWSLFTGTPKGRNWFYDLFTRGRDPEEKTWESFTFPSSGNPYFPPDELEDVRRTLPDDVFRQEYMAEFLEDSAGVFRNIEACLMPCTCRHIKAPTSMGVDLAKHQDFTVCIALCTECHGARGFDRFNQIDWGVQKKRIISMAHRYNAHTIIDATGLGDPIFDDLRNAGLDVEGYKLSQPSKAKLIQGLMVAVEQEKIHWPREWETLTNEMKRYEYVYSRTGSISYNAPAGYHDDCVIALALANFGLTRHRPMLYGIGDTEKRSKAETNEQRFERISNEPAAWT